MLVKNGDITARMISRKTVDFNSLIPNVSKSPLVINWDWPFWVCDC